MYNPEHPTVAENPNYNRNQAHTNLSRTNRATSRNQNFHQNYSQQHAAYGYGYTKPHGPENYGVAAGQTSYGQGYHTNEHGKLLFPVSKCGHKPISYQSLRNKNYDFFNSCFFFVVGKVTVLIVLY